MPDHHKENIKKRDYKKNNGNKNNYFLSMYLFFNDQNTLLLAYIIRKLIIFSVTYVLLGN